ELIDRLLKFSKNEREEFKPLSLAGSVRVALQFVSGSLPANVSLQTKLGTSDDTVLGLEAPLELIVLNLVSNAGYVMRDSGGELVVSLSNPDSQHIELAISDTGPGIPAPILDRIFDPFYTTKPPAEGTGLGLLMVKEAVEKMKGRVEVDSIEGQGTQFLITFPLCDGSDQGHTDDELPKSPRLRVMVIDDEEPVLQVCQTMLEHLGHEVIAHTDPNNALREDLANVDLVISDYRMGGVSGLDFVKQLQGFDGPVVVMSGALDADDDLPENVSCVLNKPFKLQSLQEAVLQASQASE
ncbi:MAG: ATP-binding protein, partial [Pseudomonadota bacterium]